MDMRFASQPVMLWQRPCTDDYPRALELYAKLGGNSQYYGVVASDGTTRVYCSTGGAPPASVAPLSLHAIPEVCGSLGLANTEKLLGGLSVQGLVLAMDASADILACYRLFSSGHNFLFLYLCFLCGTQLFD